MTMSNKARLILLECWYKKIISECGDMLDTDPDELLKQLMEQEGIDISLQT